jgi:hypothetical protein
MPRLFNIAHFQNPKKEPCCVWMLCKPRASGERQILTADRPGATIAGTKDVRLNPEEDGGIPKSPLGKTQKAKRRRNVGPSALYICGSQGDADQSTRIRIESN